MSKLLGECRVTTHWKDLHVKRYLELSNNVARVFREAAVKLCWELVYMMSFWSVNTHKIAT